MQVTTHLSARASATGTGVIDELFALVQARPDVVSFAAGAPDASLLPVELLGELTAGAVARFGRNVLQYGATQGFPPLRDALVPLVAERGIAASPSEVHVATGGSGALNNVCMALLDPGDLVVVERPTYAPAVKVFRAYGADVVDVACDSGGVIVDALDDLLHARRAKVVYLLPTFQNPTGRSMPADRRAQLATVARRHDVVLIEDDVYVDLRYAGPSVPALAAHAPERTVYVSSISKVLAPAMRTGVVVMPAELLGPVLALKQGIDMQTSSLTQALVCEFLTQGHAPAHLDRLRAVYTERLDVLLVALADRLPPTFRCERPDGGMFVWLTGPPGLDAAALLPAAIDAGVAYVPGEAFHVRPEDGRNTLRLGFAGVDTDRIAAGVERLAPILAETAA